MPKSPMPEPGVSGRKTLKSPSASLYSAAFGGEYIRIVLFEQSLYDFKVFRNRLRGTNDSEPYCQIACF
jgi:hypothetical protein